MNSSTISPRTRVVASLACLFLLAAAAAVPVQAAIVNPNGGTPTKVIGDKSGHRVKVEDPSLAKKKNFGPSKPLPPPAPSGQMKSDNGNCLGVKFGRLQAGTPVVVWDCENHPDQIGWAFQENGR